MASQEHLQQLTNDDEDSSSSSTSLDVDGDVNLPSAAASLEDWNTDTTRPLTNYKLKSSAQPKNDATPPQPPLQPKMRIKLSMRRLPTKALAAENAGRASSSDQKRVVPSKTNGRLEEEDEIKATIVDDSDEAGDVDAVAAVVETPQCTKESSSREAVAMSAGKRQRSSHQIQRSIRLPPLSSPGILLIPTTNGVYRGAADSKGFATPASVFDHAMSLAGYTIESRTAQPHRGSSVKRGVGDMYDSNVKMSLHFPELIPQELLTSSLQDEISYENGQKSESYAQILLRKLSLHVKTPQAAKDNKSRKRQRQLRFDEMIPVSLTIPFPEGYIQKRLQYVESVQNRENAIIAFQEAEEAAEMAQERYEEALLAYNKRGTENGSPELPTIPAPIEIPPIPGPPTPPHLSELEGYPVETMSDDHPRYFPKEKEFLVSHLDRDCFHITEGRYFGLTSSAIADPLFVGPNAPGVAGSLTASTGLATVNTGSSGAASAAHSPSHVVSNTATTVSAGTAKALGGLPKESTSFFVKKHSQLVENNNKDEAAIVVATIEDAMTAKIVSSRKKKKGPTPTATSSSLRKIMEDGGEEAELMKTCIIRAAVYASRAGTHGQSFVGCNGETYPDISKAFAAHAGLKPCNRCKTNKQGAYHCRLRRKHKDLDYDGGNSPALLAPLFQVPPDELLWKRPL